VRNWGARVHADVRLRGYTAAVLENEFLRVTVLPGRGGDVVEFLHKPTDSDFCTFLPQGLRPADEARGLDFMAAYYGGWQEVFPSGGPPCDYAGVHFDQHAEVALLPWSFRVIEDQPSAVAVELEVCCVQAPFRLRRQMRLQAGKPELCVRCAATNQGAVTHPAMWGLHLAFGPPFGRPGCRLELPAGARLLGEGSADVLEVLRRAPQPGEPTRVEYLTGFARGAYRLLSPDGQIGLQVAWDARLLPYLWCWREAGGSRTFPWYGRAYVFGLEPFSSHPNGGLAAAVANGSALLFQPGESRTLEWSVGVVTP
jgi:hypothetical protein